MMRIAKLASGESIPALGQGTWQMAEERRHRAEEIAALRLGLDLGMTLIDTAEMYANGAAEKLVGEAVAGRRNDVFLVSKVVPDNATRRGTIAACERSLRRLGMEHIDLYLLHWRGQVPLAETVAAFSELVQAGKIRYWGVSNFDVADMEELTSLAGGAAVATNQVLYNLKRRSIEYALLPWCSERKLPIMAYSPIEQGRLLGHSAVHEVAIRHARTPAQIALAWVLRQEDMIAIPKARTPSHVRDNRAALDIAFTAEDIAALDRAFPAPASPRPLELI